MERKTEEHVSTHFDRKTETRGWCYKKRHEGETSKDGRNTRPVSRARSSPVPGVVAYFRHGYSAVQE